MNIITLGCSKNLVDSEAVARQFEAAGFRVLYNAENRSAKVVLVNTCGFIGDAKEESVNTILACAKAKQQGKIRELYVMGCLSERYRDELQAEIPEVDRFYGKFDFKRVVADLTRQPYREEYRTQRVLSTPTHYAYLKISEGCNQHCSYCAIPLITGNLKSKPQEEILEEVNDLVAQGVSEFQLIAQDLTSYGQDLYREQRLPELVERIADVQGVRWIRLHYAYPTGFPMELLRVMRERENVCKYLDIALQHISDNMLRRMRRRVTAEQTYALIDKIREEVPGIHLRTTLMVGHPGETEEDFEQLLDFVRKVRFERMGAFAYSHEEGTYAALHYEDDVPEDVKQVRLGRLMEVQQEISWEQNQRKIGQKIQVIVDRREGDAWIGRTQFDSPEVDPEVILPYRKDVQTGMYRDVRITDVEPFDLFAEWA